MDGPDLESSSRLRVPRAPLESVLPGGRFPEGLRKCVVASALITYVMGHMRLGRCPFSFVPIPPGFKRAGGGGNLNDDIISSRLDL